MIDLDAVDFAKGAGLVTVVCQDAITGDVLMVAHADREALEQTLATGEMHYWSRTRGLWHKGESSGNRQIVKALCYDCDADAILAQVESLGPACHTGSYSCFGDHGTTGGILSRLDAVLESRAAAPDEARGDFPTSYTQRLLRDRNLRLKKLGEESSELITACADGDTTRAVEEAADVLYHVLVALRATGGSLRDVERELARRHAARDRPSNR